MSHAKHNLIIFSVDNKTDLLVFLKGCGFPEQIINKLLEVHIWLQLQYKRSEFNKLEFKVQSPELAPLTSLIMMQLKLPCWKGLKAGFFSARMFESSMLSWFSSETSSRDSSVFSAQSVGTNLQGRGKEQSTVLAVIQAPPQK